ncbi:MAG: UDP-N-acetylmuramoyl-tripeptide--D-alanyl-D-alanine ligase, partial [Thermodesulfobacteriota bacterium]
VLGCHFDAAVFTNLTQDHLDYHGTISNYFEAKKKLFTEILRESEKKDKFSIINFDDPYGREIAKHTAGKIISYSIKKGDASVYPEKKSINSEGIWSILQTPWGKIELNSKFFGQHNLSNILAAAATALSLGTPISAVEKGIQKLTSVPGRLDRVENSVGMTVLVDYAHTPDALNNVLNAVRPFTPGNLILVFGCGGDRDSTKRPVMGKIARTLSDVLIVTSDNPRTEDPELIIDQIEKGIFEAHFDERPYFRMPNRREAIRKSIEIGAEGDTVIIAGKGHENYQIIGTKKLQFDDKKEANVALVEKQNGLSHHKQEDIVFSGVSTDSRRIKKDELFFALSGENFDGHDFIGEAFEKGAKAAVVEKLPVNKNGKLIIQVLSTVTAFGELASAWRKSFPDLKVAAITGSNGKTTTKEMASSILSLRFSVLKNSGNFNNLIGLPLTLLRITENHGAAVVELGMNEFGEIKRLSEIARPDTGAITNIGRAHLEKLGGIEGVARAKAELVEGFTEDNTLVVNMDDPRTAEIGKRLNCKKITFGLNSPGVHVSARDIISVDFSAIKFNMVVEGKAFPVRVRGIGLHNVMNALCAGGVARSLGCNSDEIQAGLERFIPSYMRLEVMDTPLGFKVINDTYNANPDSMRKAIEELARLRKDGHAVAVLGDMLELGNASEYEHESVGEFLSEKKIDFVIAYGKHGSHVLSGTRGQMESALALSHEQAAEILIKIARPGDLVLVKGSRGMKMENVIQRLFKE